MNKKSIKILVFLLLLVLFGSFLVYKIDLPAAQDLPRQMQNGADVLTGHFAVFTKNLYSYTEPNQSFANHHWFYGVIVYLMHQAIGYSGMVVFKTIFFLVMFGLLFYLALKKSGFWLVALFSLPTIFILINRSALRPEMFSYFFVVLFLYFLLDFEEHPEHKRVFWLIPLQLIWVNTHIFFGIGIMLVLGFLIQNIIIHRKDVFHNILVKKLFWIFLASIVVIFINPFGLKGVIFSLMVNTSSSFPISSAEVTNVLNAMHNTPGWDSVSIYVYFISVIILALSFISVFIYRWRTKKSLTMNNFIFYLGAGLGSGLAAFFVVRALPLFGIIFFLAITNNLSEFSVFIKSYIKSKWFFSRKTFDIIYVSGFVILIIYLIFIGQTKIMNFTQEGLGLTNYAESSALFFKQQGITGPIFNDTDIGSYLIGELYPREKVFTDNRFGDAYSAGFFSDTYLPFIRDENAWSAGLAKYNFNAIFFYTYDAVDGARDFLFRRIHDPAWAWVYADSYNVILVRNIPQNKGIIQNYQITNDNITQKLSYLSDSQNPADQLAAADLFNLVGRVDLSMPLYLKYVSEVPDNGKVWMVMGKTELTKANTQDSNPYLAAIYLERALANGWNTWETYSYLALAYYRTGQMERTREMVKDELKVNPDGLDAQQWLGVLAKAGISENK